MDDGTDARRADLEMQAFSANVAGKHGIQNAAWWKIILVIVVIVAAAGISYWLIGARSYTGPVEWRTTSDHRQLQLGAEGVIVELDESTALVTVDGAAAMLPPGELPGFLDGAPVAVTWSPYLTKRNGVSGEVVTLDLKP